MSTQITPPSQTDIWKTLSHIESRGKLAGKAGSLSQLHAHRQKTLSQFFTPEWLTRWMWSSLTHELTNDGYYSAFDNSFGSGAMFVHADASRFSLNGFDVDETVVSDVTRTLDASGFELDLRHANMQSVELGSYSIGVINPPFSLQLESGHLTPFKGITHYGKQGPDSSALSHEYALAQALAHCDAVAAIVPGNTLDAFSQLPAFLQRLCARIRLPKSTFIAESVKNVDTNLLIFGRRRLKDQAVLEISIDSKSSPIAFQNLDIRETSQLQQQTIHVIGTDQSHDAITLPCTNDKRVLMKSAGRWIQLSFFDGATEARVKNALFRERLYSTHNHRYPKSTRYSGQFQLNLDVIALQPHPLSALDEVKRVIARAGGEPVVTQQLSRALQRVLNERAKMIVPYGRTVYRKGAPIIQATAKKMALLNHSEKGAVVMMGEQVTGERLDNGFLVKTNRGAFSTSHDTFFDVFDTPDSVSDSGYWEEIHPPIKNRFPNEISTLEQKALRLGIDRWLNWDFQLTDLCELAFRPHGGICGWQMGLGKSRLALALSLITKGPNLIVLKSRLVDEMAREMDELAQADALLNELSAINLKHQCNIIKTIADTQRLKQVNIISYETLRKQLPSTTAKTSPITPRHKRIQALRLSLLNKGITSNHHIEKQIAKLPRHITFAALLKNRINTVISDEGGVLANTQSEQTKAHWQLNAKRRYIFDGTPCPNYPREMMALAAYCTGQARNYQPYSLKSGVIYADLFNSAKGQMTGKNAFYDRFVKFEWATNEFLDSGKGAKREVPKIKPSGLEAYRQWVSPLIKRRVQQEPAVAKHVRFPVPTLNKPTHIDWDINHLVLYVRVFEEFANWYKNYRETQFNNSKALNLTMILAKLEACFKAANAPSMLSGISKPYLATTSKERACVELVIKELRKGRKPIVFAKNPVQLKRLKKLLDGQNIESILFTGEETIDKRLKTLNSTIRNEQDTNIYPLLASLGVTQDGLNLHQINTFIFYNRSYKAREEFQAIYRLIRPQQKDEVYGYFLHLKGSIDDYMGQLIQWKTLAAEAGLDFGEQPDDDDFSHFDAFLNRFLNELPHLNEIIKKMRAAA